MSKDEREWDPSQWEELQLRWVSGDNLTPEELSKRESIGKNDPLAKREFELYRRVREYAENADDLDDDPVFVEQVMQRARTHKKPSLRVLPGADSNSEDTFDLPVSPLPHSPIPQPRRRLSWRSAFGGFAVATAAAAAALFFLDVSWEAESQSSEEKADAPPAHPTAHTGTARSELVLVGGEVHTGVVPQTGPRILREGERITTGRGRACLVIEPHVDVCLAEQTEILLGSLAQSNTLVRVLRGTAVASLTPREEGHTFSLVAGDVLATARGTVFALEVSEDQKKTSVAVVEGLVDVDGVGPQIEHVGSGTQLELKHQDDYRRSRLRQSDEARLLSLLAPRDSWLLIEPMFSSEGSTASSSGQGAHQLQSKLGFKPSYLRGGSGDDGLTPASARALISAARRELGRANVHAALALYEKLRAEYPDSPEARTVLVTLGKLQLDLSQPERALVAFNVYLADDGPLVPEALAGKVRALAMLGDVAGERETIEEYLYRYPTGYQAPWLKQRVQSLSGD